MRSKAFVMVGASRLTFVVPCLKNAGFRLTTAEDFDESRIILAAGAYDLIVYEFSLDQDYEIIIKKIRKVCAAPLLALVESRDYNALESFLALADDAMLMPFDNHELTARARALAKYPRAPWREKDNVDNCLRFGKLRVFPAKHTAAQGHKPVKLTPTECSILILLASHPGRLFSRTQIYDAVRDGYSDVNVDKTVSNHMSQLRKKLRKISCDKYITSERDIGYRFEAQALEKQKPQSENLMYPP